MTDALPVVAIEPTLRNDLMILISDIVPEGELRCALMEPDAFYRQRRAEIRLLLDLILPPPGQPVASGATRDDAAASEPTDWRPDGGSLLR